MSLSHPPFMPRLGPRLLFFSGGTALRETARELSRHTSNSIHIMTPFDSGGSSAALRRAFDMPAVGDIRSRIMALADDKRQGNPEIYSLFAYRLPKQQERAKLRQEFDRLAQGTHPLIRQVPQPMRDTIIAHLGWFSRHMPASFPLAGANVGNLVLTAGYLSGGRRFSPVISLYSSMVRARGLVLPVVEESAHLAVRLADGSVIVGQHRFTGKECACISSRITDIWLTRTEASPEEIRLGVDPGIAELIRTSPLVCYPIGSFFSSVVANLLPKGVGKALARNSGLKIFIPNPVRDPELFGQSLQSQVEHLLRPLVADAPGTRPNALLSCLLIDPDNGDYPGGIPEDWLSSLGITLVRTPLIARDKGGLIAPELLVAALLRLARQAGPPEDTLPQ